MAVELICYQCGERMTFPDLVGRRDDCPKCGSDAHVCKNCQHYDKSAYNECRETSADVVREKDRANFCDYFTPKTSGGPAQDKKKDLLAAAEALFKKKT